MTNPNDPAFPADTFAVHKDLPRDTILKLSQCQGMTKREYFAGLAMQGMMTYNPEEMMRWSGSDKTVGSWIASNSVQVADDLIAELSKETK